MKKSRNDIDSNFIKKHLSMIELTVKPKSKRELQMVKKVLKALNVTFVENDNSVLENIKTGLEEMKLFKNGELKTSPAKDFLE